MKTNIAFSQPSQLETDCLVAIVLDRGEGSKPNSVLESGDKALTAAAAELFASGEVTGRLFETTMIHHPQGLQAKRLLLVGGGKAANFSGYELRKLAGTAVRFLKPRSIRQFAFIAPEGWSGGNAADAVKAVAEGAFVGNFDPDTYKSDRKDQRVEQMTVVAPGKQDEARLRRALEEGRIVGESQNFTRELVNEPSNRLTPTVLAERAQEMVREIAKNADGFRLSIETYGADKIKELKMGAFWSVAQGSDEPPALIIIKYEPQGAPQKPVLGLVGKGVTFDTGGISIKPADGMEKMKYDMAGGASMLGAIRALAQLKPSIPVTVFMPCVENMPGSRAQRPGDIVTAMSGKTIEVINTDAEGRLILADALVYARNQGCTHLVDAATLTG